MEKTTWQELLRDAIRKSGQSALSLSKAIGVSQPTISAFLNGTDIRLTTAEKIGEYFAIELKQKDS